MKPVRCSVKYFCFGSLMIFIGSVLLCSLGITIVLPYEKTKQWIKVVCVVSTASYNKTICSCDQHEARTDCNEIYPCLQIRVAYEYRTEVYSGVSENGEEVSYNESVEDNNRVKDEEFVTLEVQQSATLYKTWSDSFYKTCSLHVCGEKQWNNKEADSFHKKWGRRGQSYDCYADPMDLQTVILDKIPYEDCVHALVWPLLCLVCGILVWGGLYVGCTVIESHEKTYCPQRTYIGAVI